MTDRRTPPSQAQRASGDLAARERLVEAARVAFATHGFHGTTTRHIAAEAGMSPAAVYVHHASKEALLFALSLEGHQATLQDLRQAAATAQGPTAQLRAVVFALALREAVHHTTARIVNYQLSALSDEHRERIDVLRREIQEVVLGVLRRGCQSGEFSVGDLSLTATSMIGMSLDVSRWFHDTGTWSAHRVAEHHAEMAVRMVAVQACAQD